MHLFGRSFSSLVAGTGITAVVFHFNTLIPHNLVAFVFLSLVFAYILWTVSLVVTWSYWGLHRDHATPADRKSASAAAPVDLAAHRPYHFPGGSHRAS